MGAINNNILREITNISRCVFSLVEEDIKDLEINRAQYPYIKRVYEHPGCSQYDLSQQLKFKQSIISKTVNILIKKGIFEKVKDENDRRIDQIWLTTKGIKIALVLEHCNEVLVKQMFEDIDINISELKFILDILTKMRKSLDEHWSLINK